MRTIENEARAVCDRHGETIDAALKKYDAYLQALKTDSGLMEEWITLQQRPIRLISMSGGERRKEHELRIAAALLRQMEEVREILRQNANGARLFQVGVMVGELYRALRFSEIDSDRGRRAQEAREQQWAYVRLWCKKKAFFSWDEGSRDSVPALAKWLRELIDPKEFGIITKPPLGKIETWIRPFAPASVKKPGRPKKPSN